MKKKDKQDEDEIKKQKNSFVINKFIEMKGKMSLELT